MSKKKKWIQDAIKRPGALREKARRAGAISRDGTISSKWLDEQSKGNSRTAKQARLAKTLKKLRK